MLHALRNSPNILFPPKLDQVFICVLESMPASLSRGNLIDLHTLDFVFSHVDECLGLDDITREIEHHLGDREHVVGFQPGLCKMLLERRWRIVILVLSANHSGADLE